MSTYEISKSSLLSLKAEILRKKEELTKVRANNETIVRNLKKNSPLEIKNKGLQERQKNDITEEEADLLKISRTALETKARLYDKLAKKSNFTDEEIDYNRRFLVRFDKKRLKVPDLPPEYDENDVDRYPDSEEDGPSHNYDLPKSRDEEWVEYVDCLGRTRTCLRKDLEYLKSKDKDLKPIVDAKRRERGEISEREPTPELESKSPPHEVDEENELLSNDMRRELSRKQWEKEEEELRNKHDIHYQDILFNEARTHGVGYYGFSKDEEERAKQQEALKKLREETVQQQKKSQELKTKREQQLAARLKAARNRKRARMGLPPEENEPEPAPVSPSVEEPKLEEPSESEKKLEDLRKKHIRPWDIGKEGVKAPKKHYEYTQEEWVDRQRRERVAEFAPPSQYSDHFRERRDHRKSSASKRKSPQRGSSESDEDSGKRPINPYTIHSPFDTTKSKTVASESTPISKGYNPFSTSKPMAPVAIVNECSDDEQDSLMADYHHTKKSLKENDKRDRGVEIAPPPTYDYYGPHDAKKRRENKPTSNVSDSIEAGLKYLREQMEKKQSSKGRTEDMFLH